MGTGSVRNCFCYRSFFSSLHAPRDTGTAFEGSGICLILERLDVLLQYVAVCFVQLPSPKQGSMGGLHMEVRCFLLDSYLYSLVFNLSLCVGRDAVESVRRKRCSRGCAQK